MRRPKLPPPREWQFNERDFQRFEGRFWRCPLRLVHDGTWAGLWRPAERARGGGAAGSLLPVLALHAYPAQTRAEPGWTAWVPLSRRRMARLAGLDKDTATQALRALAALGLVEVEQRKKEEDDPRTATWLRIRADLYPADGEPYLVYPAEAAYSGFWARLPGEGFRHLLIAWAAAPPSGTCTARSLVAVERELVTTSGMGRTAVRAAASTLLRWRGPRGARLIVRRNGAQVAHLAPPRAVRSAGRKSGAIAVAERPKPAPRRPEAPAVLSSGLPPLSGPGLFEARKAWWIRRYLGRWAARGLWRRSDPVGQALFVDLAPGDAGAGLPAGLVAAWEVARRVSRPGARVREALKIYVVEPDAARREELRKAAMRAGAAITLFPDTPEAFLDRVVPHRTEQDAARRGRRSLLFFLGSVETPAVSGRALRGVAAGEREAVALSTAGAWEAARTRLWRGRFELGDDAGPVERLAGEALGHGARVALAVALRGEQERAAGTLLHLAGDASAMAAFKPAISPRTLPAEVEFEPVPWVALSGAADQAARRFAGRRVRWSGPMAGDVWEDRIRRYVLHETPLMPRDLSAVRREMVWRGWRSEVRPAVFSFPP
jgi:hypothetical protein